MLYQSLTAFNTTQWILLISFPTTVIIGSLGISPKWKCTHFLKIGMANARGGFNSYFIHQGNKSDKERKIVSYMHTKRFNKDGCNFTSTVIILSVITIWALPLDDDSMNTFCESTYIKTDFIKPLFK